MRGGGEGLVSKPNYRWVVAIPGRGLLIGFDGGLQTYMGYPNELNWMQVKNRGSEEEAQNDVRELRNKIATVATDDIRDRMDTNWAYPRRLVWCAGGVQLAAKSSVHGIHDREVMAEVAAMEQGFPAANRGFIVRLRRWLAMD